MNDLNAKVDRVDADVRALRLETKTEFAAVRSEMRDGFEKVDKRFEKVDERFDKVNERFDKVDERFERLGVRFDERLIAIYRTMIAFCGVALAALIGLLAERV